MVHNAKTWRKSEHCHDGRMFQPASSKANESESSVSGTNHNRPNAFREITPKNLLSFGPTTNPLSLRNLNVLIGPNGSGKSNLLETIALLRSAPSDLRQVVLKGGGITEWIWKGEPHGVASVNVVATRENGGPSLRHTISFRAEKQTFRIEDERIENEVPDEGENGPYFYYRYQNGKPVINPRNATAPRKLSRDTIEPDLSILAQRRDPETFPEITFLAGLYDRIRLYREWSFGRDTVFRNPQKADMRNDRLEENFSNLGLFLNRLRLVPRVKSALLTGLRDLYEGLTDFEVSIEGGTVQVFFSEGDFSIPAPRLSDGSIRYLCLLAILCDPDPPPLIGIEEPELGLHPDLIPKVADLLKDASTRTQLIVTTHSDILVDALSDDPEAAVVCEKHAGKTSYERLERSKLAKWLSLYRLGQLWTRGDLGGTRW